MHDNNDSSPEALLVHAAFLKRIVRFMVSDGNDVDDVIQEVWVAALRRPPTNAQAARSWLWRVASNVVKLRIRTESRERRRARKVAASAVAPSIDEIREREEIRRSLLESLLTLRPAHREVLLLRFFEELSWKEVAARLDVPLETARTRAKRARVALRAEVEERTKHKGASLLALIPLLEIQDGTVLAKWSMVSVLRTAAVLCIACATAWWGVQAFHGEQDDPGLGLADRSEMELDDERTESAGPELRGLERDSPAPGNSVAERSTMLRGRVIDQAGSPLPGAEVRVGGIAEREFSRLSNSVRSSRENGAFELSLPDKAGELRLVAHKPGYAPAVRVVGSLRTLGDIRLIRTGLLHIRVRDKQSDEPIPGATAEYVTQRHGLDIAISAGADGQGRLVVDLPWGKRSPLRSTVRIGRGGYAPLLFDLSERMRQAGTGTLTTPWDVYLTPAEGLRIRVVDEEGKPAAGVRVRAWSCPRGGRWSPSGRASFTQLEASQVLSLGIALTDGEGEARVGEAPAGRHVVVLAQQEDEGRAATALLTRYRGGRREPVTLRLRKAVVVRGRVQVGALGVGGATVVLPVATIVDPILAKIMFRGVSPQPLQELLRVRSDRNGHFTTPPLPLALHGVTHQIQARHGSHGYGQASLPPAYDGTGELRISLPAGRAQRLHVIDETGQPVPHAGILDSFRSLEVHTDFGGWGAIALGKPGSRIALQIQAPGFARTDVVCDGTLPIVRVTLRRSRSLTGRVVGGSASVSARLVLHRVDASSPTGRVYLAEAHTDESGQFAFENAGSGPWILVATPHGSKQSLDHRVSAGESLVEIRLQGVSNASRLSSVEGAVVDDQGDKIIDYVAKLRPLDRTVSPYLPVLTGSRFRFEGLPAGEYQLEVRSLGRLIQRVLSVRPGEELLDLRLTLPGWASIKGSVVRSTSTGGSKPALAHIRRQGGMRGWQGVRIIDSTGAFKFSKLAAGTYEIYVSSLDSRSAWTLEESVVEVVWGEAASGVFHARPAGRLVIIAGEQEAPASIGSQGSLVYRRHVRPAPSRPGGTVSIGRPPIALGRKTSIVLVSPTGERIALGGLYRGSVSLDEPLEPGRYELHIKSLRGELREDFTVRAGGTATVDLRNP